MRLALFFLAASLTTACRYAPEPEPHWDPTERWLASPAMSFGGWKCTAPSRNGGVIVWNARLDKDNYYWCWSKDAPREESDK